MTPKQLELNSLLYVYEAQVLAIYDMERADLGSDDFIGTDLDLDATIAKRRAEAARLRHQILSYAEAQ